MYVLLLTHNVQPHRRSQVSRHGTDRSSPRGTQMPTEGTGTKPPLLWRKPMAQVTYRGVEYDSAEYNKSVLTEASQHRNHDLMYRGIKVERKFASKS